jgi:tetratricopeptide (TPR) repeat protein
MMEHNVQAQSYFEQSLGIVREIGDRHLEGFVLDSLGRVFYYKHEYARSKSYYEQALACDVEIDHRYGRAESLAHLGDLYQAIGDYAQAQARYAQAIDIFREMGSWAGEGDTLAKLARLHYHLGDAEIAYEHSQQALSIAQEWGMRAVEKRVWIDLGHALTGLGRLAEAAENYQQAVDGAQPDRCCESLEAMAGLANICLVQNDPDRALTIVEKVMGCIQQGKSALYGIIEPMWIYLVCARTLRATRDPRTAEILAIAYRLLQEQAAQLPAELRPMFLEAVPAHRELAKLANIRDVQVLC